MIDLSMKVTVTGDVAEHLQQALADFKVEGVRLIAGDVLTMMKRRVHKDGKNSAESAFGTYSTPYMRIRRCNNRTQDTKIIISLTRELENSYGIIPTDSGGWAIAIVTGAGEGGSVGFRNSCKTTKTKGKKTVKKSSVKLGEGKTRKTASNSEKLGYLEERYGQFMTKLSKPEETTAGKLFQDEWIRTYESQ